MMPTARPVAYVRRSARSRNDPGDLSREFQVSKVRELAGKEADRLLILDADWGRSAATDKTAARTDFTRLLALVEAGEVSALYAYATDRLARSVEHAAKLLNYCRRAGVPIVTAEGRFEPGDAMTNQLFYFQAMQNEGYSAQSSTKRRATVALQKARGDTIGQKPYGDLPGEDWTAVVDAFKQTGTYQATARLLTTRGIKSRQAHLGKGWGAATVKRTIELRAPELVPTSRKRGVWTVSTHRFSRLLICPHDGSIMTTHPRPSGKPSYACTLAPRDATHPRPSVVSESYIMPWAMAEVASLLTSAAHTKRLHSDRAVATTLDKLRVREERVKDLYADGLIDKPSLNARLAKIAAEKANLSAVSRSSITFQMGIDWDAPAGEVNARLRELWTGIRLAYVPAGIALRGRKDREHDLQPIGAYWRFRPEGYDDVIVEQPDGSWYLPTTETVGSAQ